MPPVNAQADAQWVAPAGVPVFEQSVQFVVPEGAQLAYWDGEKFVDAGESMAVMKLLVGGVYQLRVTQIPQAPGAEVFPTIEVLNRLNPPPEQTEEFSVVVEIPWDDLLQALDGKLVTRVVYLEDPATAMPYPQAATEQPYFDVTPQQDPLRVAKKLGRPMARVRLGSRIPDSALGQQ